MIITRDQYENYVAFLQAVCRIAADRLRDGGTFPIKGETWELLDYAAGPETQRATLPIAHPSPNAALGEDK